MEERAIFFIYLRKCEKSSITDFDGGSGIIIGLCTSPFQNRRSHPTPKGNPLGQIPRNFSRKWSNAVHKLFIQM